jgi:hypothetical protein
MVTMLEALQRKRMYLLGDRMIATLPVLALRLIGTPDSGYAHGADGQRLFTTAVAQLYCGKELISAPAEQQIAWFLIMNGRWDVSEAPAEFDGRRELLNIYVA